MAKYVIRNLTQGRIVVPHPINLPIDREQTIIVNAPAHLVEQFNYKFRKHLIADQIRHRIISMESLVDETTPDVAQVPTLEIVKRLISGASALVYYFGQQIYSGPDIPSGTTVPGGNFFDFTLPGLFFFNVNPKLQNCRVYLNGVLQVNGDSFSPQDVRLGPNPAVGDLVFTNPSITIRSGDVIAAEANL